jgi:DNA-binding NarL/FixJ family response regulator
MSMLRVFLVDDHAILRDGLRALIALQSDMQIVGEAADGAAAVDAVDALRPDVVVMDLSMPLLSGADATKQIIERCPAARVLALTAHEDAEYIQVVLQAGASGYLLKRAAAADLVRAIHAVAAGRLYLDTTTSALLPTEAPPPVMAPPPAAASELSEREATVLKMVAMGYSAKRMAASLDLSPRTLETYKKRGMAKLGLENRADIVRFAIQQGWLKDA